jgi:hypothetical protein
MMKRVRWMMKWLSQISGMRGKLRVLYHFEYLKWVGELECK